MALPLNVLRTVPYDVPPVGTQVYEAPVGYNAIVLLAQVCNTGALTQTITLSLNRGSTATPIVFEYEVPAKEILKISGGDSGRLVMETGDKLILSGSSTELKFILSLIETLR